MALSFIGCAHNSKNTIGGVHKNLETGLSVYHQYHITTEYLDKNKKLFHHTSVFLADYNKDLPSNTKKLYLSIAIINPFNLDFEIWERVNYIDLRTDKVYFKSEKLRYPSDNHRLLPEGTFSLDLPLVSKMPTQVLYFVNVKDKRGEVIYSTYTARYKIGSKK
jgi:hypothetical protein